jgi:hypothetical protein
VPTASGLKVPPVGSLLVWNTILALAAPETTPVVPSAPVAPLPGKLPEVTEDDHPLNVQLPPDKLNGLGLVCATAFVVLSCIATIANKPTTKHNLVFCNKNFIKRDFQLQKSLCYVTTPIIGSYLNIKKLFPRVGLLMIIISSSLIVRR